MMNDADHVKQWVRYNLVLFLLGCFLLIDVLSLGIVLQTADFFSSLGTVKEIEVTGDDSWREPRKLSEIKGPMIDDEAAAVVVESSVNTLPLRLWVFLLIAYAALLIFNLSYDFQRTVKLRWGWEVLLTLVALVAWYIWDERGVHLWYPLAVMKTGFLIYAIYLYLFDRKMLRRSLEEERIFAE